MFETEVKNVKADLEIIRAEAAGLLEEMLGLPEGALDGAPTETLVLLAEVVAGALDDAYTAGVIDGGVDGFTLGTDLQQQEGDYVVADAVAIDAALENIQLLSSRLDVVEEALGLKLVP